jgi:hypothetical protein
MHNDIDSSEGVKQLIALVAPAKIFDSEACIHKYRLD